MDGSIGLIQSSIKIKKPSARRLSRANGFLSLSDYKSNNYFRDKQEYNDIAGTVKSVKVVKKDDDYAKLFVM